MSKVGKRSNIPGKMNTHSLERSIIYKQLPDHHIKHSADDPQGQCCWKLSGFSHMSVDHIIIRDLNYRGLVQGAPGCSSKKCWFIYTYNDLTQEMFDGLRRYQWPRFPYIERYSARAVHTTCMDIWVPPHRSCFQFPLKIDFTTTVAVQSQI